MERYHIFKLGLAIIFYAAYCIRPMLVHGLRSNDLRSNEQSRRTQQAPKAEDYLVYYQGADGIPGVDFPVLSNIPRTSFSCKGIDSGYYADLDTDCQVFHICEEGKKISFLCPNGTIFEQSDLICEWWYKVNCTNAPNLYAESAEQLKVDLAKGKASRKVYLDGHERQHGAVMRTEESASVSAKQNGKQIGKSRVNVVVKKQQIRGPNVNTSNSPQRAINLNKEEQEKPKRYNDAETGNYINNFNKPEGNKNLKEYHLQFSDSTSASTAKSIFTRSTTPSSVPSFTLSDDTYNKAVSRNRGTVRFGDVSGGSTLRPTDDYTLSDFPTHKSESSKSSTSKQKSTVALTKNDIVNKKLEAESEELQVPQETAAFATSSYNGIRKSSRKFLNNQHPNHRAVYSDLKQPNVSSPKFVNPINSVTPQYITTQSINNGKPFIGSTVGGKVFKESKGSFASASTVSPLSTTYLPPYEDSSRLTTPLSGKSTKKTVDYATVYGTFSKRPVTTPIPPNLVEVKFDKDQDKIGIQLGTSVGGGTPKYSSAVVPPLLTTDAFVQIGDTQSTPLTTNAKDVQISTQGSGSVFISGRGRPSISNSGTNLRLATTRGQSGASSTPAPGFAEESTSLSSNSFVSNQPVDATATFRGDAGEQTTPKSQSVQDSLKYSSAVLPPLLFPDAFVHTNDLQSTTSGAISFAGTASTRGRNHGNFDKTVTGGFYQSATPDTTSKPQIVKGILKYSSAVVPPLATSDAFVHGHFEGTTGIGATSSAEGFGIRINTITGKSTTPLSDAQPSKSPTIEGNLKYGSAVVPPSKTDSFIHGGFPGSAGSEVSSGTGSAPPSTNTQSFEAGTTQFIQGNLKYASAVVPPLITSDAFVRGDFQGTTGTGTNSAVEGSGTGFSGTTGYYESTTPLTHTETVEKGSPLTSQTIEGNLKYGSAVVPPSKTDAFIRAGFPGSPGSEVSSGTGRVPPSTNTQSLEAGTTKSQFIEGNLKYASAVVPPLITSDAFVHGDFQGSTGTGTNSAAEGSGTGFSGTTGYYESTTPLTHTETVEKGTPLTSQTIEGNLKYGSAVVPPNKADAFIHGGFQGSTGSEVSSGTGSAPPSTNTQSLEAGTTKSQFIEGNLKYASAVVPPLITSDAFVRGDFQGTTGTGINSAAEGSGTGFSGTTGYYESTTPLTHTETFEKGTPLTSQTIEGNLKYDSAVVPPSKTDAFIHGDFQSSTGSEVSSGSGSAPPSTDSQSFEAGTIKFTKDNLKYGSAVVPPLITSNAFVHGDFQATGANSAVENSGTGFGRTTGYYESTTPLASTETVEKGTPFRGNLKYASAVVPPLITSDAFVHGDFLGTTGIGVGSAVIESGTDFGRTANQYEGTTPLPNTQTLKSTGAGIEFGSQATGGTYYLPLPNVQTDVEESQSFEGSPKYASAVVPPLLTSDAFVHSTGYQGTTGSVTNQNRANFDKTTESTQTFRESTTPKTHDAFAHSGELRTATNDDISLSKTTTKQITVDVSQNNIASTLAPESERITSPTIAEEIPRYSSAVTPASLTPDAVIHISDFQRTPSGSLVISPGKNISFIALNETTYQSATRPQSIKETVKSAAVSNTNGPELNNKYASATVPPLLTTDAFVHVGDFKNIPGSKGGAFVNINGSDTSFNSFRPNFFPTRGGQPSKTSSSQAEGNTKYSSPALTPDAFVDVSIDQNSVTPTPFAEVSSATTFSGFYLTKNGASTSAPVGSTPVVNVNPNSGENYVKPPQITLSSPKFDEPSLVNSESKWPRPFQKSPNSLSSEDLKTEPVTPTYFTYKISSARPFHLPEDSTPIPTLPTSFTTAATQTSSVYENVDNMINILKEIANVDEKDFSSETPRPGLVVPPSVGPQTLHSLAVYFATALDGISAERAKVTGEELDNDSKEKLTGLLTQMTMYRYKELFKGKNTEDVPATTTEAVEDLEDDSANAIDPPALRNLARNFTLALSSYLNDPDAFRKELVSLRPTEPPPPSEDNVDGGVGEEELLNFSDADTKSSFPPVFPTLPSVKPTWGFIIAGQPNDLDVKNSLNPDLNTADTQSFVPGFNNIAVDTGKGAKGFSKPNLPGDHWTTSSGATKLWQSAFSVNPAVFNEEFKTTEPLPSTTEAYITAPESSEAVSLPQSEIQYDLRTLPKIKLNSTQVHGILIDFMNTTKTDESNRLQRLLKKLNTSEDEFLDRMKEIEANPLTRRLILLLISECAANATKDVASHSINSLSKELLESSSSNSAVTSHNEGRQSANSYIPELVDPKLQQDEQDTRALQLLNSLYTIASRFGK